MKLRSWFVYTAILALVIPLTAVAEMVGEGSFDRTLKVYWTCLAGCANGFGVYLAAQRNRRCGHYYARIRAAGGWFSGMNADEKIKRIVANPPVEQTGNVIRIGRIEDSELRNDVPSVTRSPLRRRRALICAPDPERNPSRLCKARCRRKPAPAIFGRLTSTPMAPSAPVPATSSWKTYATM